MTQQYPPLVGRAAFATAVLVGLTPACGTTPPTDDAAGTAVATAAIGSSLGTDADVLRVSGQSAPPVNESREEWMQWIEKTRLPKVGCSRATYPSTSWKQVPCVTASSTPVPGFLLATAQPQLIVANSSASAQPAYVGGGGDFGALDFSAFVTGTISTAAGTFPAVTGLQNATDDAYGADAYSLQLNTNKFTTTACGSKPDCRGVVQFALQNQGTTGSASIWYILYKYSNDGSPCPTRSQPPYWQADTYMGNTSCYLKSPGVAVNGLPSLNSQTLSSLRLHGSVTSIGQLGVTLYVGGTTSYNANFDDILNLAQGWNVAEFNIFGYGAGSTVNFNTVAGDPAVTITVQLGVANGTASAPTCRQFGVTAEKNGLSLANYSCCSYGGSNPYIRFMQSNANPLPAAPFCLLNDITAIGFPLR